MCMLYLYIHVPCSMCTRVLPNLLPRDRILRCQACLHARCGVCRRPMLKCVRVLSSASVKPRNVCFNNIGDKCKTVASEFLINCTATEQ